MQTNYTKNGNPQMSDLLDAWGVNIGINLNCHALGTIEAFDAATQTATISINYKKTYVEGDVEYLKSYPPLSDCPVIMMSGGGATLTFPIKKGDTCLILFNDRSIDNWYDSGQVLALDSKRNHSLSDGIALVGLRSKQNVLEDYDENRSVLRKGAMAMGVGDKVLITKNYPAATETLNSVLQNLVDSIKDLTAAAKAIKVLGVTTGGGISGLPSNAATFTAISSDLTSIATEIGELLE